MPFEQHGCCAKDVTRAAKTDFGATRNNNVLFERSWLQMSQRLVGIRARKQG